MKDLNWHGFAQTEEPVNLDKLADFNQHQEK